MMAVRSRINQYFGVNAHLHSYWQAVGGWSRFHTNHIADLMRVLVPVLLPMGYDADVEPSLQIRRIDDTGVTQQPEADVMIYDLNPTRTRSPQPATATETVMSIPQALYGELLSEKEYSAVKIYERKPGKPDRGEPVAWIELLSPSNKPGGQDADAYFDKRLAFLDTGVVFVEIDYLHESAPTLRGLPSYRARGGRMTDDTAHAYRIVVIDPRPDVQRGTIRVSAFDVDAPIPRVDIPLSGDDVLHFDFGVPYRKTFEETLYGLRLVDYAELPQRFDRYDSSDQARVAARMLAVLRAARDGVDLETGPFPAKSLALDAALEQVALLKDKSNAP